MERRTKVEKREGEEKGEGRGESRKRGKERKKWIVKLYKNENGETEQKWEVE